MLRQPATCKPFQQLAPVLASRAGDACMRDDECGQGQGLGVGPGMRCGGASMAPLSLGDAPALEQGASWSAQALWHEAGPCTQPSASSDETRLCQGTPGLPAQHRNASAPDLHDGWGWEGPVLHAYPPLLQALAMRQLPTDQALSLEELLDMHKDRARALRPGSEDLTELAAAAAKAAAAAVLLATQGPRAAATVRCSLTNDCLCLLGCAGQQRARGCSGSAHLSQPIP